MRRRTTDPESPGRQSASAPPPSGRPAWRAKLRRAAIAVVGLGLVAGAAWGGWALHDVTADESQIVVKRTITVASTPAVTDGVTRDAVLAGVGRSAAKGSWRRRSRIAQAGDPQRHTHVLDANASKAEGRYTALHGALLYREAKTGGMLYHAVLRTELTHPLGVEWEVDPQSPFPEIAGIDSSLRDLFSKRADEIQAQLDATGSISKRAADAAAIDTRAAKGRIAEDEDLREGWIGEVDARQLRAPRDPRRYDLVPVAREDPSSSAGVRASRPDRLPMSWYVRVRDHPATARGSLDLPGAGKERGTA